MPNIMFLAATNWYFAIWVAIFVIAIVAEAIEPQLISIWFAGGALVALILSLFPSIGIWIQLLVFALTSGVLLILSFAFFRKSFLNKKSINTNVDALVEEEVRLLTPVSNDVPGSVLYRDIQWAVVPKNVTDTFSAGEIVVIDSIRGNRLVIRKKGEK